MGSIVRYIGPYHTRVNWLEGGHTTLPIATLTIGQNSKGGFFARSVGDLGQAISQEEYERLSATLDCELEK